MYNYTLSTTDSTFFYLVDGPISEGLWWLAEMTMSMAVKFGAVILITPVFIGPGVLVFILGGWCGQRYIAAQLAVKRGMSNAKAPVLGQLVPFPHIFKKYFEYL